MGFPSLGTRISQLHVLATCAPTPLLRRQMKDTIALHERATENDGDLAIFLPGLEVSLSRVEERWAAINKSMLTCSIVRSSVIQLRSFLLEKLLEDYTDRPFSVDSRSLDVYAIIVKSRETLSYDTNQFRLIDNLMPLEEMALDTDWVEGKLSAAVARSGAPCNDVQACISRHDWAGLAARLVNDLELVSGLEANGLCDSPVLRSAIRKGIEATRKKYFAKLDTASDYCLNTSATRFSPSQIETNVASTVRFLSGFVSAWKPHGYKQIEKNA